MAFAFDTLGYSKHLQDAVVPRPQAEAHAEAVRDFIMRELVTKDDLNAGVGNLQSGIENAKSSLTIRLGSMIGAGIAALAVLQRLPLKQ
jgi:hypothetical protein